MKPMPALVSAAAPALIALLAVAATLLMAHGIRVTWRRSRTRLEDATRASLAEFYVFLDPGRLIAAGPLLVIAAGTLPWVLTGSPVASATALAATLVAPPVIYRIARSRRRARLVQQVPDALALMAASLRAGASAQVALARVAHDSPAPLAQEVSRVLREQRLGTGLDDALEAMSRRLGLEEIALWVTAISLARGVGGNLAEILERLATTLRAKAALEGKVDALTSQGRLQGLIVGLLPLGLGAVLFQMDPEAMRPLLATPAGWAALAAVAVLELTGALLIRRIVRIDI
jgi:tight adherence protein B